MEKGYALWTTTESFGGVAHAPRAVSLVQAGREEKEGILGGESTAKTGAQRDADPPNSIVSFEKTDRTTRVWLCDLILEMMSLEGALFLVSK